MDYPVIAPAAATCHPCHPLQLWVGCRKVLLFPVQPRWWYHRISLQRYVCGCLLYCGQILIVYAYSLRKLPGCEGGFPSSFGPSHVVRMEAAVPALLLVILALGYGSVVAAAGRAELSARSADCRIPTGTTTAASAAARRRGSADSSNGAHSSSDPLDTHDEDSDSGSEDEHNVSLLQRKSSSERLPLVPENKALSGSASASVSPPRTSDEDEEFDDELEEESWNSPIKVTQWSVTGAKLKERMPLEHLRAAILSRANTATLKSSTSTAVLCGTAMTALLPPVYLCYSLLFGGASSSSSSSSSSSEQSCDSSAELQSSSAALCDASSSAAAVLSVCSVAYIAWPIFQEMAVTELTYRRR
jgi:Male germ-cell putative homeodomain transcription factor